MARKRKKKATPVPEVPPAQARIAAQKERRDAAIAFVQAELDAEGSATFGALQRVAVETYAHELFIGDAIFDERTRVEFYKLANKALSEAAKLGRHLAKDHYRAIKAEIDRRSGTRSRFDAARAPRRVSH